MTSPTPQELLALDDTELAKALMRFMPHSSVWPHPHVITALRGLLRALAAPPSAGAGAQEDVERKYRALLWQGHGHSGPALYGDDGEMQCKACRVWDYRRAPLEELEKQTFGLKLERLAEAQRQAASPPPPPPDTLDRETLVKALKHAEYYVGYVHHSGYPVYDGGHTEPESECQQEDCKVVRDVLALLRPAPVSEEP